MQGIQSLHGWMSAQTKITPKIKKKAKNKGDSDEEVNMVLRFSMQFVPFRMMRTLTLL